MPVTSKRNGDSMLAQGELIVVSCWCGIKHAVPEALYNHAKESSDNHIYCPLGHTFVYRDSDATKLRRELAVVERQRDNAPDRADAAKRTATALKGHLTRMRRRVANGVCPVPGCKRHFPNVQAHVETAHAEWLNEHPEVFDATG